MTLDTDKKREVEIKFPSKNNQIKKLDKVLSNPNDEFLRSQIKFKN